MKSYIYIGDNLYLFQLAKILFIIFQLFLSLDTNKHFWINQFNIIIIQSNNEIINQLINNQINLELNNIKQLYYYVILIMNFYNFDNENRINIFYITYYYNSKN